MATRESLQPRLAQCGSAADCYALALEAFDAPADLAFAREILSEPAFKGDAGAKPLADDAAGSAMFTKDFVCAALAYSVLGDAGKAGDALKQGQDFAMSGEEKVQAGVGAMLVSGDKAAAVTALSGALKEISTTEELYALADTVTGVVKDAGLATQVFDKIQAKAGRAADFARLARTIAADLGDKAKAVAVLNEGAAKYGSPADLIALSGAMGEIDPAAAAGLYDQALQSAKDFNALLQVLAAAKGNADFTRAVLTKGGELASSTGEFLQLAEACAEAGDAAAVSVMLQRAEDAVSSLDEMRRAVEAVEKLAGKDAARIVTLKDKLARREANQAKYVELQNEEANATTVKQLIALADRVMAELADVGYAGKLLSAAEARLREDGFHFSRFKPLILAVDRIGDKAWLTRLLDESVASAADFIWFREIVTTCAREFKDTAFGRAQAQAQLDARAAQASEDAYAWTKLAELARDALGDASRAANWVSEAAQRARDHFALAQVAKLYHDIGQSEAANAAFAKAAEACRNAEESLQLANRLKTYGLEGSRIAGLMDGVGARLASAADKLHWAAGVADLLMDKDWVRKTYDDIAHTFSSEAEKHAYERSRQMRLGYRFYGPGAQPH